jgi:haloalkane dehalogenase
MEELFRTPDERFAALPGYDFEPHWHDADGLRMHYVDEGAGDPIVCFHGEPTWAYLYRKMLPPLVGVGMRVVCPDYAGFGRSDKPTDRRWYSYDRHVDYTARLLAALDLREVTVIVQDWGGPIGLRWAVENAERVARLVILNTGLFTGRVSKGFMAWRDFAERNPDLPVGFVLQGATATELPDEVVAAYEAPFPTPESKAGAAQFPMLVPIADDQPGATEMRAVADELARWKKPALVAFSDEDPVFPYPRAGERFTSLIPSAAEQVRIEGAAHFLQEDAGERIAEIVAEFVRGSPGA